MVFIIINQLIGLNYFITYLQRVVQISPEAGTVISNYRSDGQYAKGYSEITFSDGVNLSANIIITQ